MGNRAGWLRVSIDGNPTVTAPGLLDVNLSAPPDIGDPCLNLVGATGPCTSVKSVLELEESTSKLLVVIGIDDHARGSSLLERHLHPPVILT